MSEPIAPEGTLEDETPRRKSGFFAKLFRYTTVLLLITAISILGTSYMVERGILAQEWDLAAQLEDMGIAPGLRGEGVLTPPELGPVPEVDVDVGGVFEDIFALFGGAEPRQPRPPRQQGVEVDLLPPQQGVGLEVSQLAAEAQAEARAKEEAQARAEAEAARAARAEAEAKEQAEARAKLQAQLEEVNKTLVALKGRLDTLNASVNSLRAQDESVEEALEKINNNPAILLFNSKGELHPTLVPRRRTQNEITQWRILGVNTDRGIALVRSPRGEDLTLREGEFTDDLGRIWGLNYNRERQQFIIYTDIGDLVSPAVRLISN